MARKPARKKSARPAAAAGASNGNFQAPARITLWDIERKKAVRTFVGHTGRVTALALFSNFVTGFTSPNGGTPA